MKFTPPLGGTQQQAGDYKHLDTSLYFIITNFHTELK